MTIDAGTLAAYASWLEFRQRYLRVPGVQAAVWADGEIARQLAFGHSDLAAGTNLSSSSLFRVASHSKTFTAVAVMQLVGARRLRLDDRVADILDLHDGPLAEVTIRDLLAHSGGVIRDSEDGDFWQLARPFPDEVELRAIAVRPSAAVYEPGEHFKYTNIGYGLLGLVIERVTGQSYADALTAAVLRPLGLKDSGPELAPTRAADYAVGYSSLAYAAERTPIEHVDTRALAAATGWWSTATELATFYAALLPGGELLSEAGKRQLRHPLWATEPEGTVHYGMGLILTTIGDRELFGHSGSYPGHITRTLADAERGIVACVLTNAVDGPAEPMAAGLFQLLDLGVSATHAPAGSGAERFTGRFASLWGVQDVVLLSGRLFAYNPTAAKAGEAAEPLEVVDEHTLQVVGGPGFGSPGELVHYRYAADGTVLDRRAGSGLTQVPVEAFRLPAVVRAPRE